ncbi:ABC transporter permease subunit [Actinopolymorpha alba]|uniref:ABC transporter permease subunit n=1 Tax=Actinopolymorpha alba TaxID=533267 RepID=UPI000378FAE7|nr:ABC transporter permease subunit [Actinopolymorpha alba]
MIWLTWRQFRTAATAVFGGLAALAAILAVTGPRLADDYATGLADCTTQGGDCSMFVQRFFNENQSGFLAVTAVILVLPALIGLFWGAPLISRELETGTHRLVWNQSITRTRWLAVKLGLTGLAAMAATALCSLAVTWWSSTVDQVATENFPRLGSLVFDARGVVPIGYAAFAFALGVTVGMLVRRAQLAMAITLTVFVAVQIAMPTLVRPHLLPPTRATVEISHSVLDGLMRNPENDAVRLQAKAPKDGDWLLSSQTVDAAGKAVDDINVSLSSGACAPATVEQDRMATCFAEISRLGYRVQMTYHAANRFWPFQWIETGIYTTSAVALTGFCFWWTRRRLS